MQSKGTFLAPSFPFFSFRKEGILGAYIDMSLTCPRQLFGNTIYEIIYVAFLKYAIPIEYRV